MFVYCAAVALQNTRNNRTVLLPPVALSLCVGGQICSVWSPSEILYAPRRSFSFLYFCPLAIPHRQRFNSSCHTITPEMTWACVDYIGSYNDRDLEYSMFIPHFGIHLTNSSPSIIRKSSDVINAYHIFMKLTPIHCHKKQYFNLPAQ